MRGGVTVRDRNREMSEMSSSFSALTRRGFGGATESSYEVRKIRRSTGTAKTEEKTPTA